MILARHRVKDHAYEQSPRPYGDVWRLPALNIDPLHRCRLGKRLTQTIEQRGFRDANSEVVGHILDRGAVAAVEIAPIDSEAVINRGWARFRFRQDRINAEAM